MRASTSIFLVFVLSVLCVVRLYLLLDWGDVPEVLHPPDDPHYAPPQQEVPLVPKENKLRLATLPSKNDTWVPKPWSPVHTREWCFADPSPVGKNATDSKFTGLIYVKIPKSSSSTLAGINFRLARSIGSQVLPVDTTTAAVVSCSHSYSHGSAQSIFENRRQVAEKHAIDQFSRIPLVWTFLRDPASRALSQYFHFQVSRRNKSRRRSAILKYVHKLRSSTFEYIRKSVTQVQWAEEIISGNVSLSSLPSWYILQRLALEPYNFIGLVERRDESLAALKLLWNLTTSDLVVLSAKGNGGYDDGQFNESCHKIQPVPQHTQKMMSAYFANEFRYNNADYLLYAMVNDTLDKTIEALGRDIVAKEIEELQRLQRLAEDSCSSEAIFPCSSNGTRQLEAAAANCYENDFGCGYPCVDRVLETDMATFSS